VSESPRPSAWFAHAPGCRSSIDAQKYHLVIARDL
jgi:hypothetical protein